MPTIDHHAEIKCLVAVRGHPFDRTAFAAVFEGMEGISATMVDQPAAALLMNPDGMRDFDVLVLYDMPGIDFAPLKGAIAFTQPEPALKAGFQALLEEGKGVVALHHALAGWPLWPDYGAWLGGRFYYQPMAGHPDSGYHHDVVYEAQVVGDHPVTAGLPESFKLTDELYLGQIFESDVTPLLRSSATFTRDHFWSAEHAIRGEMFSNQGWDHPPGSNLIGWAKQALRSRLVYLQPGDGPSAYENPNYRLLIENAIRWVA
jgi:type 1 glutamine amidotransferase